MTRRSIKGLQAHNHNHTQSLIVKFFYFILLYNCANQQVMCGLPLIIMNYDAEE